LQRFDASFLGLPHSHIARIARLHFLAHRLHISHCAGLPHREHGARRLATQLWHSTDVIFFSPPQPGHTRAALR
jgi:putative hemolysin